MRGKREGGKGRGRERGDKSRENKGGIERGEVGEQTVCFHQLHAYM